MDISIKMISCGKGFVMVLSESGFVYSYGNNNDYGQLGLKHDYKVMELTYVEFLKDESHKEKELITHIECGENHTIALSIKHKVYTWGNNHFGQLGLNDYKHKWLPVRVDYIENQLKRIVNVSASIRSSYIM